jgi:hypothetical protein
MYEISKKETFSNVSELARLRNKIISATSNENIFFVTI